MKRVKKPFNRKPRATLAAPVGDEFCPIVLEVDMAAYYEWLSDKLSPETIEKIKMVNNRDDFERFMNGMKIDFIFAADDDELLELPAPSSEHSPG